jgi:hypothetical protein
MKPGFAEFYERRLSRSRYAESRSNDRIGRNARWPAMPGSRWVLVSALVGLPAVLTIVSSYRLWSAGMLAFGDLTAYPAHASGFLHAFHSGWSARGLGGPFTASPAVLVEALFILAAAHAAHLAQFLFMAGWIPLAFAGMVYLCRRGLGVGWGIALLGGVIYPTTPVAIGLFVAGAGGLLWAYALVPFVVAAAEKVRVEGFRATGWLAAAVALLSAFSPELLIFGIVIAFIGVVVGPSRRRVLPAMAVALAVATIAALPGVAGRAQIPSGERLVDKALLDFNYTYAKASLPKLLRLAGNQGDPMDPLGYDGAAAWTYAGFLPVVLFSVGLFRRRRNDVLPLRLTVLGVGSLCALVVLRVLAERRDYGLLKALPPLLAFRNPEKIMILLAAALVAGAMYGAACLLRLDAGRRRLITFALLAAVGVYLALYARPAFMGDWGIRRVRGDAYVADRGLLAAARYLQHTDPSLPGKWRIAWVPFSTTDELSLEWVLPEWANEPVLESTDPDVADATNVLEKSLDLADMRSFHSIADRAAVKYVVVRAGTDAHIVRAIRNDPKLRRIHTGRGFVVWRNIAALPRIRSFSGLTAVLAGRRSHVVEFQSAPIVRLQKHTLSPDTRWTVYPRAEFAWAGNAIRIRATGSAFWPVLSRRVSVYANTSYAVAALVRTSHAAAAQVKVIWYRRRGDVESEALREDFVGHPLTGDQRWTRVAGIVESPPGARFGELTFLAGKRLVGGPQAAVSWIRNLQIANYYRGDPAPTGAEVVPQIQDVTRPRYELADAASLAGASTSRLRLDAAIVNPVLRSGSSKAFSALLQRADRISLVAQAEVALQPRTGVWRRTKDSAEVLGRHGEASLSLGRVPSGDYVVSVVGCHLAPQSMRIVRRTGTLTPHMSAAKPCGEIRSRRPIALSGPTVVQFAVSRGASIERVEASSVASRLPSTVSPEQPIVTAADSTSPTMRGLTSAGLTLADAFDQGWRASGSNGHHVRTLLGFNGFLVDQPRALSGLSYQPQRTRDVLLVLSFVAWFMIGVLLLLAAPGVRGWLWGRVASRPHSKLPDTGRPARSGAKRPLATSRMFVRASASTIELAKYREREPLIAETLLTAQGTANELREQAERDVEQELADAEELRRRAEQNRAELASDVEWLQRMRTQLHESMRLLQLNKLDVLGDGSGAEDTEQKPSAQDETE